jgi:hypothetical protein
MPPLQSSGRCHPSTENPQSFGPLPIPSQWIEGPIRIEVVRCAKWVAALLMSWPPLKAAMQMSAIFTNH